MKASPKEMGPFWNDNNNYNACMETERKERMDEWKVYKREVMIKVLGWKC